jgi:hypothetical protein
MEKATRALGTPVVAARGTTPMDVKTTRVKRGSIMDDLIFQSESAETDW